MSKWTVVASGVRGEGAVAGSGWRLEGTMMQHSLRSVDCLSRLLALVTHAVERQPRRTRPARIDQLSGRWTKRGDAEVTRFEMMVDVDNTSRVTHLKRLDRWDCPPTRATLASSFVLPPRLERRST